MAIKSQRSNQKHDINFEEDSEKKSESQMGLNNRLQALNIQTTGLQNGVNSFIGNVTNSDKPSA